MFDLESACGEFSFFIFQVSDHLKAVAKDTNVRVVPIVGGMSMEKQERLLKARPEIIVGTPGRLWELMSGGEKHLVEVSTDNIMYLCSCLHWRRAIPVLAL